MSSTPSRPSDCEIGELANLADFANSPISQTQGREPRTTRYPPKLEAEQWPQTPEARAVDDGKTVRCSNCHGRLQLLEQNRCPYVACRMILRGKDELHEYRKKQGIDHA
jgi:hypothetical protein